MSVSDCLRVLQKTEDDPGGFSKLHDKDEWFPMFEDEIEAQF